MSTSTTPQKILIIKLGAIGDVVHAIPVLSTLRANLPDSHITWVIEKRLAPLIEGNPHLDDLLLVDTKKWRKKFNLETLREIFQFLIKLRRLKADVALDLQGLVKSGVICFLSGAKQTIGFVPNLLKEPISRFFTNTKSGPGDGVHHIVDICLSLLKPLGIKKMNKSFFFYIHEKDETYINSFLQKEKIYLDKPIVILNPGAGWKSKEWGVKNYALLGDKISDKWDCHIIISWGPGEEEMANQVKSLMKKKPTLSPKTTIKESIALYKRANLFIGADTGPLHIAAAIGIPTIALFGPSLPERNGPWGDNHEIVYYRLHCGNCYKRDCDSLDCMKKITVDDVLKRVNENFFVLPASY